MADVIIRGMNMPKERSLWLCIKTDGTVYNIKPGGIGTAHAVGTAVPLPEGHGRLIDADAPVRVVWSDGTIHSTTVSRLLCMHSLLGLPKTIVPAEGGNTDDNL
jgi:hypothetical protein